MGTRSFIARPTDPATGSRYAGIYCHFDGYPDYQLPLLLGALRYRFNGDIDALRHHLIDAPHEWSNLGLDLLRGAPDHVLNQLDRHKALPPSTPLTDVITPDGKPAEPFLITERNSDGLDWGYVLHDHGIEVISLTWDTRGPIVGWDTSPLARILGGRSQWEQGRPAPVHAPRSPLKTASPTTPAPAASRLRATR